jgi:hypothetical protein
MAPSDCDASEYDVLPLLGLSAPERNGSAQGAGKLHRLDTLAMVNTLPPEVPWLVEPVVVQGALTLLYGREGEGKSLLAMALAIAVASGEPVAGFAPKAGRVVYIDAENGEGEIHRRIRALGLPSGAAENLIVYTAEGLDLRRDLDELAAVIERERPVLVVLDSFRSLWGGKENDSDETGPVLDRLRNLGRRLSAAILLVHHSGKSGSEYRGSTGIGASCELIFHLARQEEDDDLERRFLSCRKSRPAPEPQRRWLRLSVEMGMTFVEESEPPEDAAGEAPGRPPRAQREMAPRVVETLQKGGPMFQAGVAKSLGRHPSDGTVRRVLEKLDGERVRRLPDGRWEALPEPQSPRGSGNSGNAPEDWRELLPDDHEEDGS